MRVGACGQKLERPNNDKRMPKARARKCKTEKNEKNKNTHQRAVDVRDDTAAGDRGLDERVELLVSADGQLQVAGRDALDLEVLGRVARELEHLGRQVLCFLRGWFFCCCYLGCCVCCRLLLLLGAMLVM